MSAWVKSAQAVLRLVLLASSFVACGIAMAQDRVKVEVVPQVGNSSWVHSVAFSPDGRTALSGSADHTLKLWDVATGKLVRTLEGHSDEVTSVAFSPDGRTVLSGSWDHTLKLWDAATGKLVRTFERHSLGVTSVAFSPDGRSVLSGSVDNLSNYGTRPQASWCSPSRDIHSG
jgi:WD40 repeat protein